MSSLSPQAVVSLARFVRHERRAMRGETLAYYGRIPRHVNDVAQRWMSTGESRVVTGENLQWETKRIMAALKEVQP
jgi:hypothetical protein